MSAPPSSMAYAQARSSLRYQERRLAMPNRTVIQATKQEAVCWDTICSAAPGLVAGLSDYPPAISLCGQYAHEPGNESILISTSVAANFGLREPGTDSTVAVLFTSEVQTRVPLEHLLALTCREAAIIPKRFQDGSLRVFLHFKPPGGQTFQTVINPAVCCQRVPTCLRVCVSDLAGGTYPINLLCEDISLFFESYGNEEETDRVRELMDADDDLLTPLTTLDREHYIDYAAEQARLALRFALVSRMADNLGQVR